MLRFIIIIFSLLFSLLSQAAKLPKGCEVTGYTWHNEFLVLNEDNSQAFYLIKNRSDKPIEMVKHDTRPIFMSPKLKARLAKDRWGGFASDEQHTYFKCYSKSGDNIAQVNCSDVLELCQYPRVKFALSNMGTYWVSTNKSQSRIIRDAIRKGILLRW